MNTKIKFLLLRLKFILRIMLSKDDAKAMKDKKKDSYVNGKALEYIPICFKAIRESVNNMKYTTSVHIEGPQFIPDIINELEKVFNQLGYKTTTIGGRGKSMFVNIFWRDLTEEEKIGLP